MLLGILIVFYFLSKEMLYGVGKRGEISEEEFWVNYFWCWWIIFVSFYRDVRWVRENILEGI